MDLTHKPAKNQYRGKFGPGKLSLPQAATKSHAGRISSTSGDYGGPSADPRARTGARTAVTGLSDYRGGAMNMSMGGTSTQARFRMLE
jgi:hypothetical protein